MEYAEYAYLTRPGSLPGAALAAWFSWWWLPILGLIFVFTPLLLIFAVEAAAQRSEVVAALARLRREGRSADTDYAGRSLRGQLTQAQRLGAETIVIAHEGGFTIRRAGEPDTEIATLEGFEP